MQTEEGRTVVDGQIDSFSVPIQSYFFDIFLIMGHLISISHVVSYMLLATNEMTTVIAHLPIQNHIDSHHCYRTHADLHQNTHGA